MKTFLLASTVLAAFTLTASVHAEGDKAKRPHHPLPKAMLEKFDTDGDGKLSDAEREAAQDEMEAMRAKMRERMLAEFDKDGDGELNEAEREAAKKAWKDKHGDEPGPIRERILKKFDKDGDGKLNEKEREAAKEAMKEHREKNGKGEEQAE